MLLAAHPSATSAAEQIHWSKPRPDFFAWRFVSYGTRASKSASVLACRGIEIDKERGRHGDWLAAAWTGQRLNRFEIKPVGGKLCLEPAPYWLFCPANDFLDSTDYAADTNFTATRPSATLHSFHAPVVTRLVES